MFHQKEFADNLIRLRKARGWNAAQFAKEIGMSKATVSCWESCERLPSIPTLLKIADLFDVSLDELVGRQR